MTALLWERRGQIGCCLLIQAVLLSAGLALERLNSPTPEFSPRVTVARTRG
jgi:hypothetical protein